MTSATAGARPSEDGAPLRMPRGAVWLVFAGVAAIAAGVRALRAPAGHRGYAVFRSLTIFGAVVAVVMAALVVAASFITL